MTDTPALPHPDPTLMARIVRAAPFAKALDISLVTVARGEAVLRVPYREDLIGNPSTKVIHGGVVTTLLDHTLGCAAFSLLEPMAPIATLDMRIDYMRAAEPGREILARAVVTRVTSSIAFVSGAAYHDHPHEPIATSSAAFMLSASANGSLGSEAS